MTTKPTGGPAFPTHMDASYGMTLRDYFAGQALAGMLANPNRSGLFSNYVDLSFIYADAMLKERDK